SSSPGGKPIQIPPASSCSTHLAPARELDLWLLRQPFVTINVSEPGAIATGSKNQLELTIRSLPLAVLTHYPSDSSLKSNNRPAAATTFPFFNLKSTRPT